MSRYHQLLMGLIIDASSLADLVRDGPSVNLQGSLTLSKGSRSVAIPAWGHSVSHRAKHNTLIKGTHSLCFRDLNDAGSNRQKREPLSLPLLCWPVRPMAGLGCSPSLPFSPEQSFAHGLMGEQGKERRDVARCDGTLALAYCKLHLQSSP